MDTCLQGVYRQRKTRKSALFKIVKTHYGRFEEVYEERFAGSYGRFRPVIRDVVEKYLACGDLKEGFARVRCPDCRHEYLLPFSCQIVLAIPKMIRVYFRFDHTDR